VPRVLVARCGVSCLSGIARHVGGWVCYRLVSELLVETLDLYGLNLLVKVSWL
jgi:hypothetical protein